MPWVKIHNTFRDELSFIIQFGWNHVDNIRPNTREGCFLYLNLKLKKEVESNVKGKIKRWLS